MRMPAVAMESRSNRPPRIAKDFRTQEKFGARGLFRMGSRVLGSAPPFAVAAASFAMWNAVCTVID